MGLTIPPQHRMLAERIIAERPAPSQAELAEAEVTIEPTLKQITQMNEAMQIISPLVVGAMQFVGMWFIFVALPGLIAAIAFRRGLIMLIFGVDCTTRRGALASRLRMFWRWIVFNTPVVLAPMALGLVYPSKQELTLPLLIIAGVLVFVALCSSLLPVRGLADRLSGTYPVPR